MTRISFRWLSLLVLLLVLAGTSLAIATQEQIYTIKKGDTLWSLSEKFIGDPYYWPNVWAKNPDIGNPHLIFPGQKVRILDGRLEIIPAYPEAEKPAEETANNESPQDSKSETGDVVTIKILGNEGFILTDEQPLGMVVDSVDNRILLSKDDIVFLKMRNISGVTVGDTYSIFRRGDKIINPHTNKPIGTMMTNQGFLQVTEIRGETVIAKIGDIFGEIMRGAELFEYAPPRKEIALQRGTTDQKGYVVASRSGKGALSFQDVIFVNLGSDDGVADGNLFYISRPRNASAVIIKHTGEMQLPDVVLGAAIAIETKLKTTSALVIKSVASIHIGDNVSVVTH
ncbi:MAG: LysM peptidoglycan-binding domain-containing protein [Desulfuromusa sp.]|nr:LysM peptidoglycan-binding domain-containing protein [Desulfuromusa sp.]